MSVSDSASVSSGSLGRFSSAFLLLVLLVLGFERFVLRLPVDLCLLPRHGRVGWRCAWRAAVLAGVEEVPVVLLGAAQLRARPGELLQLREDSLA